MLVERSPQPVAPWAPPLLVYSDVRVKRDILVLGRLDNGINLYRYRYRWCESLYVGVMAHEVAHVAPDAVVPDADGFLRVCYRRLGMRLRTYEDWLNKGHADPASPTA